MKWGKDSKLMLAVTVAVIAVCVLFIFVFAPYISKKQKEKADAIKAYWADKCYVQIVNKTNHKVSITLYGHENGQVVTLECQIPALQQVMLKEDMVWDECREFPPKEMSDSALMVFDDTLFYWQIPALDKASMADHHSLYAPRDWDHSSIVVRPRRAGSLYRYGKEFVLKDRDYEQALGIKRYRGQIIHERE